MNPRSQVTFGPFEFATGTNSALNKICVGTDEECPTGVRGEERGDILSGSIVDEKC